MKKYSQVYKYSIQGSIVNELDNYLFWESEIQARIALSDFVGAIDLAERAVLKSDRLRLLSLVARKQKEINNHVDEELILLIKRLYDTTNLAGIGDSIYDIVSNLIYSIPNLAIEILENTTGNTSESNINDWIVAKLSLAAINSEEKEDGAKESKLKALEKLNNPSVKKIQQAISLMVGDYSSKKVLEEVAKLSDSNEKLKLLRLWLKNNRNHNANLKEVILVTLAELVSSSSTSESILETLNELSLQLTNIQTYADKEELIKRFKEFEPNIKQVGLSKDLYTYKLNMFQVQYTMHKDKAEGLLISIIKDITKIEDSLIQIEAYSEVFYRLSILRDYDLTTYYNRVYGRIKSGVEKLLNESANHSKITENILVVIGKVNPKFTLEICQIINTSNSRDTGRLKILDTYLDNSIKRIRATDLVLITEQLENLISKEIAVQNILDRFSNAKSLPKLVVKSILPFISKIKTISNKNIKLNCSLLAFKVICKNTYWSNRMSEVQKGILWKTWLEVESDWNKIDIGYNISSEVSQIDPIFAKEFFEKTTEIKNQSWLDSRSVANTYLYCLRLIIKAYVTLIKNNNDTTFDFEKIKGLIDRIPSENHKLLLWSELAIGSIIIDKISISKKIYDNHIIPLTSGIIDNNKGIYDVLDCFVVIHYFNTDLAFDYLNKLSEIHKEKACVEIVDFYISKRSPFEYYDGDVLKFKSTYDNLLKAVKVLNDINTDAVLYYQIKDIAKAINENSDLSQQQKSELRNRIEDIVDVKLPDSKNITHDGYKIISKVQLQLIQKTGTPWASFIEDSQLIPNISDRILVKGTLLEVIPFSKNRQLQKQLVSEVFNELTLLSSHYEFVDRVTHLSKIMYELSRTKWQQVVNQAFDISYGFDEGQEMYTYQRNILDTIYRIDKNFAKTLVNKTSKSKLEVNSDLLKNYYQTLELSRKIKNNQSIEENQKNDAKRIINAVYRAQGSLNSGKIITKKIADVAQYLEVGKTIGLSESFPVYLYYLSNSANIRLEAGSNKEINESQRELFEYMLSSIKFVELLSQKRRIEHAINTTVFIDRDFEENFVVKPSSREEAINYIRNWIINEAKDFLIITDPYFEKEDIEILKFVKELDNEIDTYFIGCNEGSSTSLETDFEIEWKRISDQEPPNTKIIFCWIPENNSRKLIHDRWILSKNGGLRLGTSYRSLGANKETEISVIKPNEAFKILEETVRNYLENKTRYSNNQKIKYKSFTI